MASAKYGRDKGRKRRFGTAGVLNILASNICLQILLTQGIAPTWACTLTAQVISFTLGYLIYGKWVFRTLHVRNRELFGKWLIMQCILWSLNWGAIATGAKMGLNRNMTGLIALPPLAALSYTMQRNWVFCRNEA